MEKTTQYVILAIFLAFVVMTMYALYTYRIGQSQQLTGSEIEFKGLCSQWLNRYSCEIDNIEEIDATQELYNLKTLSDLCFEVYGQYDDNGVLNEDITLIFCQDVCTNSCSDSFYSDVGLQQEDIMPIGNSYSISVHNYGTVTAYDVWIKINSMDEYGYTTGDGDLFDEKVTIRPKETYPITVTANTKIQVEVIYDDKAPSNNIAESYV